MNHRKNKEKNWKYNKIKHQHIKIYRREKNRKNPFNAYYVKRAGTTEKCAKKNCFRKDIKSTEMYSLAIDEQVNSIRYQLDFSGYYNVYKINTEQKPIW